MTARPLTTLLLLAGLWTGCGSDPADLPAEEVVQSGCDNDEDCAGGTCIEGLPDGLCTADCTTQDDCPDGTICTDTEATNGVCLFSCSSGEECRDLLGQGYTCDEESNFTSGEDVRVCIDA